MMGATAFSILSSYAGEVGARGGRVYLSGVDHQLVQQFEQSGRVVSSDPLRIVEATPRLGESTRAAVADAEAFLIGKPEAESDHETPDPWVKRLIGGIKRLVRRLGSGNTGGDG